MMPQSCSVRKLLSHVDETKRDRLLTPRICIHFDREIIDGGTVAGQIKR